MKTVNKILLITYGFFLVLILIGMIILRLMLPTVGVQNTRTPGNVVSLKYDFQKFNAVSLSGTWTADIVYGTNFAVVLEVPAGLTDQLEVNQADQTLKIGLLYKNQPVDQNQLKVHIVMPELSRLEGAGGNKIEFSGFQGKSFETTTSGAAEIIGKNNLFKDVKVESSGVSHIDFSDSPAVNADVQLSGAGNIRLNMKGGKLSGNISGASVIRYTGTVSSKTIQTSGMSSIKQE